MTEKAWLSIKEAVVEYGHGKMWWRVRAKSGSINANLGPKIVLERASIEAYLNNEPVQKKKIKDEELTKATRIADLAEEKARKVKADNEKDKHERELKARSIGINLDELVQRDAEIITEWQVLKGLLDGISLAEEKSEDFLSTDLANAVDKLVKHIAEKLGAKVEGGT